MICIANLCNWKIKDLRYQCYIEQENNDIGAAFRVDWKQVSNASMLLERKFRALVAWSSTRTWLHFCDLEESRKYSQNYFRETCESYTERLQI